MTLYTLKFQEEYSAKLLALTPFTSMGWSFPSPEPTFVARGGKPDGVVLPQILRSKV